MKTTELNYVKKNGMLYPYLQISNDKDDDKRLIGKYGKGKRGRNRKTGDITGVQ